MSERKPRKARTVPAEVVFAEWRKQPGFQQAYHALDEEFAILEELIKAREVADVSQSEIARRMNTTQSAVARLEAGAHRASLATLRNYAGAVGHRVKITLEPVPREPETGVRKRAGGR
jgi:transcriptional regulator with XRE-family HTH domain